MSLVLFFFYIKTTTIIDCVTSMINYVVNVFDVAFSNGCSQALCIIEYTFNTRDKFGNSMIDRTNLVCTSGKFRTQDKWE